MALRIIGGQARGRRLASPPGDSVRPTGDRVREALFNILGQQLEGWRFLDVCAGSGAVSLEALSRGAAQAVALEENPALCRHIRAEADRLNLAAGLEIRRGEALKTLRLLRKAASPPFDAAFVDPPWRDAALRQEILDVLFEVPALCRLAVVEIPADAEAPSAPEGVHLARRADYGGTALLFFASRGEGG